MFREHPPSRRASMYLVSRYAIGVGPFTPKKCANYFTACGYDAD
jgi:hypothetical protein